MKKSTYSLMGLVPTKGRTEELVGEGTIVFNDYEALAEILKSEKLLCLRHRKIQRAFFYNF